MWERYDRLSKSGGGGEWPPLALSTVLRRRTGQGKGKTLENGKKVKTWGQLRKWHRQNTEEIEETIETVRAKRSNASPGSKTHKAAGKRLKALEKHLKGAKKGLAGVRESIKKAVGGEAGSGISILRDKGLLFNALYPQWTGQPGAIQQPIENGVRVGYGGPERYPDGRATIADIASFHQEGGPHLPQRRIIVSPDQHTLDGMSRDLDAAMRKLGNG